MYPVPQEAIAIFERPDHNKPLDVVAANIKTLIGGRPVSYRTARRWHLFWEKKQAVPTDRTQVAEVEEEIGKIRLQESNEELVASTISETIQTPERLIEVAKIDLNLWREVSRDVRYYQVARRYEQKDLTFDDGRISGTVYDEGNLKPITLCSVQVKFVPRQEYSFEQAMNKIIDRLKEQPKAKLVKKVYPKGDHLFVATIADAHFGRLSVDGTYTPQKTAEEFDRAGDALLGRALSMGMAIKEILLPFGNDAFQADTMDGKTTRGTVQEMSAGMKDVVHAATMCHISLIEKAVEVAPVVVEVVEGNHDRLSCFWLGEVLEQRFALHKMRKYITVRNSTAVRKYHRFGLNLIGMEHGDRTKEERLPLIMAEDRREDWGETKHLTWFRGHFHEKKMSFVPFHMVGGVAIITLPAFCPMDQWETIMGFYRNKRAAEGYFFHEEYGMAASFPVFVDELK